MYEASLSYCTLDVSTFLKLGHLCSGLGFSSSFFIPSLFLRPNFNLCSLFLSYYCCIILLSFLNMQLQCFVFFKDLHIFFLLLFHTLLSCGVE